MKKKTVYVIILRRLYLLIFKFRNQNILKFETKIDNKLMLLG